MNACQQPNKFKFLYDLNLSIKEKMSVIAREMYGAGGLEIAPHVEETIKSYEAKGFGNLPICMAKTSMSLTGDPGIKGAPTGFTMKINDVCLSAGAGFIVPICGEVCIRVVCAGMFQDGSFGLS